MCGIVGVYSLTQQPLPEFNSTAAIESLRHRGPDEEGEFASEGFFLGARRLAIIDPASGQQPVQNEDGRFHFAFNGEIYDYDRHLEDLQSRGHRFRSHCDTEVGVHLFEERWAGALEVIDGQFGLAAYDQKNHRLLLARDRMGICPLFYAQVGDYLIFASEAKAIFATGLIVPELNPRGLDSVLSLGCPSAPITLFRNVRALPPAHYLDIHDGKITERRFWDIPYPDAGDYPQRSERQWGELFYETLHRAVQRRLKADVPVGMYLSGGIDSSTIAHLVADRNDVRGRVFSIAFPEPAFDESAKTRRIAEHLGLEANFLTYRQEDLVRDLSRLVYMSETPLVSTESIALMALSGLASQYGKVVLTGEGADEALGGYRFFRWEAFQQRFGGAAGLLRKFHHHHLGELNPLVPTPADQVWAENAFGFYPAAMMKFRYMRSIRKLVYTDEMLSRADQCDDSEFTSYLPRETMQRWDLLNRSLYVSSRIFMSHHLLGAHGDRALMANSVEGRYPFLDRAVQELLATVPPKYKTRWCTEKYLLRRMMVGRLPKEVIRRRKQPFLAPFGTPFVGDSATEEIRELLSPNNLKAFGYFSPKKVVGLIAAVEAHKHTPASTRGDQLKFRRHVIEQTVRGMALTFVVSTQMLEHMLRSGQFGYSSTPRLNPTVV